MTTDKETTMKVIDTRLEKLFLIIYNLDRFKYFLFKHYGEYNTYRLNVRYVGACMIYIILPNGKEAHIDYNCSREFRPTFYQAKEITIDVLGNIISITVE